MSKACLLMSANGDMREATPYYQGQTAKLIFFYMPCLSEIIKRLGGMPSKLFTQCMCAHVPCVRVCACVFLQCSLSTSWTDLS